MKLGKFVLALGTVFLGLALGAGFVSCKGDGIVEVEDWMEATELVADENSIVVVFDKSSNSFAADWDAVALYVYGGSIGDNGWGGWPGLVMTSLESYPDIFYAKATKAGDGTIIFNNNNGGEQQEFGGTTFVKGQRYAFTNGSWKSGF